jgi:hypothetical protein
MKLNGMADALKELIQQPHTQWLLHEGAREETCFAERDGVGFRHEQSTIHSQAIRRHSTLSMAS